jgi:uncharacterized protein (TIGR02996 family)
MLSAIAASPEEDAPRLVLADYYLEQGNPKGEFISLQLRAEAGDMVAGARAEDLLERHQRLWAAQLLGPRADDCSTVWKRGFLAELSCAPHVFTQLGGTLERLKPPLTGLSMAGIHDPALKAVGSSPILKHLKQLSLSSPERAPTSGGVKALLAKGLPALQELKLGGFSGSALFARLAEGRLPNLQSLSLHACLLQAAGARALVQAPWFKGLESLLINDGELGEELPVLVEHLRVKALDLSGTTAAVQQLALLGQVTSLEELTLSATWLDTQAGWEILEGCPRLKVLRVHYTAAAEDGGLQRHRRVLGREVRLLH